MIKRLAIFVEGYTEQEFTVRLLRELAGKRHTISFEFREQKRNHLSIVDLIADNCPTIHILVANCCNDAQVTSQINENYDRLKENGYSLIIGLRDVYPLKHDEIPKLRKVLLKNLKTSDDFPTHLHFAVMEIEAWFLAELTHFKKINENITEHKITSNGFDFKKTHAHNVPHPAETLNKIYQSAGEEYDKNKLQIQRTVDALDYENMYINVRQKSSSLDGFINSLEQGLGI